MSADQPKIPQTIARLSTSITIRVLPGDIDPRKIDAASVLQAKALGAIVSFAEHNDRGADPRYEIDADTPGEIVEQLPQLVTRTLSISRAILYENDILEAFGISGGDLINQYKTFAIVKVEKAPDNAIDSKGAAIPTRITIYSGCWFTTNPKTFNLAGGGSLRIVQDIDVAYSRRRTIVA